MKGTLAVVIVGLPIFGAAAMLLLACASFFGWQAAAQDAAQNASRKSTLARQEADVRDALTKDPSSADRRYLLAYVLFLEHKAADSLAAYTQAAALRTPTPQDLRTVALDYVLLDDYIDAEKWIARSVEGQPESAEAWYDLGRIQYSLNRSALAVDAFDHALQRDPHSVKAENNLGLALEAEGKTTEAEAAYRQAILWQQGAAKPSEQPYLNLAILLLNLGRTDEALSLLLEAYQQAPADAKISEQLGRAYRTQGRLAEAQAALERAVALSPDTASTHYLLGQVYWKEERKDSANAEFARVATLSKGRKEPPSRSIPEKAQP